MVLGRRNHIYECWLKQEQFQQKLADVGLNTASPQVAIDVGAQYMYKYLYSKNQISEGSKSVVWNVERFNRTQLPRLEKVGLKELLDSPSQTFQNVSNS